MSYENIWVGHGVIVNYKGILSADEVFKANSEIAIHHDFGLLEYIIFNYLDAKSKNIKLSNLTETINMRFSAAKVNPNIRIAYVATDKKIISELNKMLDKNLTPYSVRIFPIMSDAEAWVSAINHVAKVIELLII